MDWDHWVKKSYICYIYLFIYFLNNIFVTYFRIVFNGIFVFTYMDLAVISE